jgi:4-hydroxybenzoate polyprenyltransferase
VNSPRGTLASIVGLRAWKLALLGPAPYWFFPIFYVLLSTATGVSAIGLTALVVAMMLSASWGFLLNDLADRDADAKSGRADALHGHGLSMRTMWALVLLTAIVSWAIVFLIGGGWAFKIVLAVDYFVATIYSVRPLKLKVRKFWGFFANSVMERPLPILVFLAYMHYYTPQTIILPVLMELTWSVFKHQAADVKEDIAANVITFAASLGEKLSTAIVRKVLNPISVFSLLLLTAMAWLAIDYLRTLLLASFLVTAIAIFAAYLGERTGRLTVYITPTDPPYIIALNLSYRYILLPVLAIGILAYRPSYLPAVALLVITLGYQSAAYVKLARNVFGAEAQRTSGA